jgi:putative NADH-flavin reductase
MNVVLYGATGMIGSRILAELSRRGHSVTAVVRNIEKLASAKGVRAIQGDITDKASVEATAKGSDAAISAYSPPPTDPGLIVGATRALISGITAAGVSRVIVVGGAGSLEISPGVQVVDAPEFPDMWKAIALAHRDVLPVLLEADLD